MADDYSPTLRDAARRLVATGSRTMRIGSLMKAIPARTTPPASNKHADVNLPSTRGGTVVIDGVKVAAWIADVVLWVRRDGWNGHVSDGYRSVADQRIACTHVCGNPNGCPGRCAKPGTSNHQRTEFPGGAVDVTEYEDFGRRAKRYPHGPTVKNDLPLDRVHFSYTGH